ncbi:RNA-binding protein 26 isoform X2 [Oryzias latipes]|uniref:RNA binding motif protein 26 n=1 Tax=Oryzias latipes TaxID=8090 RepID=A0A3B3HGS8_ORYLA|nr:RNA-binding protein 26 isoform X2 [Oryzias latipes]
MIIENLDAFKTWLSETLEPICDADPSALAKYVAALVKKDKSEKELKALCIDQLDVFLQKETQPFVDKLFEAVNNRSYLPQQEQPPPPPPPLVKVVKEEPKKDETNREEERDKKFSRRVNHSPPQSSSRYSRDGRRGDDRKRDDRSRKRDYDRIPPRRDSYRDRYNRRRGRSYSRSRSRSRSWSKDRIRDRDRERDRDRDRDRSKSPSLSRTRSRSRSRDRDSGKLKYDHDRGERPEGVDVYAPPSLVSAATTSHFPVQTLSSAITVIAPTHHHSNNTTESWSEFHSDRPVDHGPFNRGPPAQQRKRCRDYDEKGFCMRGDMCPFDHGSDPVVVEDVNLPSMLPFQPPPIPVVDQPPPPGPPPPPLINPPPMNLRPPVPPPGTLPPSLPPVAGPPPPLPPLQPAGMDAPPSSITSAVPTIVTSGIRSSIPQAPASLFNADYDTDVYNPEAPSITNTSRPLYRHRVNVQRPNLIGLTMSHVDHPPREKIPNNSMRIVMESDSRKRPAVSHDALVSKKTWFERSSFNNPNHQGYHKRTPFSLNTKLLVRQIPPELNNISKLNEHFSKFGTIVNLQVAYQNDPEGALIQFAFPEEAERAMQSTEAVLNNRFIKVHWFRGDRSDGQTQSRLQQSDPQPAALPETSVKQSIKDRLGPMLPVNSEPSQESSAASQNASKVSVKDRLGFSAKPAAPFEKVFSTSTGLTKTVYNPTALKAAQRTSDEALKKKQEALKLQQDVRKKKQEILEKHIETQKLLISRLEKNKGMKAEDKAKIMKTLDTLTKSITKLQEEIKGISSFVNPLRTAKSKVQAQKELLDIELELYQKTQAGEDTALLKIKYTQLQIEAAKRGLLSPGRGRGVHAAGHSAVRARGRGSRGRGRGMPMHAVVDHRPRALEISGFNDEDRVNLLPHFAQYGEIEDCQMDENSPTAVVTYKTRAEAERAALHGLRFNNQTLRLAWHKPATTLNTAEEEEEPQEDEYPEESLSDDALLQDDDEEEDDNEPRSWRR